MNKFKVDDIVVPVQKSVGLSLETLKSRCKEYELDIENGRVVHVSTFDGQVTVAFFNDKNQEAHLSFDFSPEDLEHKHIYEAEKELMSIVDSETVDDQYIQLGFDIPLYDEAQKNFLFQQKAQVEKGLNKYGVNLDDAPLTIEEIRDHSIQEMVDANHYIHKLYKEAYKWRKEALEWKCKYEKLNNDIETLFNVYKNQKLSE